jgi:geranylgeranyl diphosphate synthase type II
LENPTGLEKAMGIYEKLKSYARYLEENLDKVLTYPDDLSQRLIVDAVRYCVFSGGKRLRAAICMDVCQMLCGDYTRATSAACSLELIHAYSLVHDDIMDNDELRHGQPSCHVKYGVPIAILTGDAMMAPAFEVILGDKILSKEIRIDLLSEITKYSGVYGIVGGQVLDMEYGSRDGVTGEELTEMFRLKTSALFVAAARMGAIAAGASPQQLKAVTKYADNLGLAFQITDDILDVEGDARIIGKPVGSDIREHKTTYVSIYGLEQAKARAKLFASEALKVISDKTKLPGSEFLVDLAGSIGTRSK